MINDFPASFEIFILARNRTEFLDIALKSFVNIGFNNPKIIVSDNSTDNKVSEMIKKNHPWVEVRKRNDLLVDEHFNLVISESTREYLMIFHDDDIFLNDFKETLPLILKEMNKDTACVAVGINARIINSSGKDIRLFNPFFKKLQTVPDASLFIDCYIDPGKSVMPFPAYIYKTSVLKNNFFGDDGIGKYSDVTLLLKLLKYGKFLWWPSPLIGYRVHGNNDSKNVDLESLKNLCEHFVKYPSISKKKVQDFYYMAAVNRLRENKNIPVLVELLFFYCTHPYLLAKRVFYRLLRRKA